MSKREGPEKKVKKKDLLKVKDQVKKGAYKTKDNIGRGVNRPLWKQPRFLFIVAAIIILAAIGYGIWLGYSL